MEYACLKTQSASFAWRFPLGFQAIFLLLLLIAIPFYPESPRHLTKIQKLTGIDFIATYAPEMFTLAGYGGDKPALLAGGNYISYTASLALASSWRIG
jgi:hypothetical protein